MALRRTRATTLVDRNRRLDAVPGPRSIDFIADQDRSSDSPLWSSNARKHLATATNQHSKPCWSGWSEWGGAF